MNTHVTKPGSDEKKAGEISSQSEIIPRLYMKLLPVQIVLVIIGGSNAIIDNCFAGNLIGPQAMAVTGLFGPVTFFLNAVNTLIFGGAQVLCGKCLGKKMVERTRSFFSLDMIIMIMISTALLIACEFFAVPIATAMDAKDEIIPELASYIRGYAVGLPFYCLGTQFTAFLQLEHQEKRSYISVAVMFAVNAFCNWLFVAVFHMGLFGLGLSTSVGNIVFFIIQGVYFLGSKAVIRFSRESIVFSDIRDILIYGLPGATAQLCICLRGLFLNNIIQRYVGQDGLASYSAVFSFGSIFWCVPAGVSSAVMVLGSVFAGEEDRVGLKVLMKTFLTWGVGFTTIAALVEISLFYPFTNIFFHDPTSEVYRMTLAGFALYPLFAPLSTLIAGFSNYFHCLSQERIVRIISVTDGILGVCLFTLLLVPRCGMMGVWAGQVLGSVFNVFIIALYIYLYNKKPPVSLDRLMCFDRGFGVPEDNRIDITVHSMEEVINLSRQVWAFCEKHGLSRRRMYFSSLCTEELAGNIVTYGFNDKRKHSIDIRVSCINEEIVICFKDDGIPFNPEEASRLFQGEDTKAQKEGATFNNIGLHIVSYISDSMTYQNTFGLNILTIIV
ncbi:MAG: ATP-binding protein [Lachnospiraceae bacterium]|nr:ATP-binding protein [Lachnospiraceae bacterium]